jgi:glycosyltransferase involved in cell wall biosynthesis
MAYNIRILSTYPPRTCGVGIFARNLATALEHFTGEVVSVKVAAIRRSDEFAEIYSSPVDLTMDQYDADSWSRAASTILTRARESRYPTVIILQHEYGLDRDSSAEDGRGRNFVNVASRFAKEGLLVLTYLHTVLDEPDEYQRNTIHELVHCCDGLIVTTERAVDILSSDIYGVDRAKTRHIDHGVRIQDPSQHDRMVIKREYGMQDKLLVTTLGLRSPNKGIQFGIPAYARFLAESCTQEQRERLLYLIAGQCHPEFVRDDNGEHYRKYRELIATTLQECGLRWCEVERLADVNAAQFDVVFLDTFLDENTLLKLYAATNVMVLPYLDLQQMSSGILADTVGSGRVAIATKFSYAVELLNPAGACERGICVGPRTRGILVDPGEPSIAQIAQGLDYLVFSTAERFEMENRAHERGVEMKWDNVAWKLIQYIEFLQGMRERITDTTIQFTRSRESVFERKNAELLNRPFRAGKQ